MTSGNQLHPPKHRKQLKFYIKILCLREQRVTSLSDSVYCIRFYYFNTRIFHYRTVTLSGHH